MFNSIRRKTVGLGTAKNQPVNAEFDNLRQSLDNVSKALTSALADIDSAEKSWKTLVTSASHFSSALHSLYPTDDDLRALFKTTHEQVSAPLTKQMAEDGAPDSQVKSIERMVRAYLTEIKTLSAEYTKVDHARRDYAMFQAKADKLAKKNSSGGGGDKQTKNIDKNLNNLEESKAKYNSILEGTVHRMKSTYDKATTMFRAAFVAYWLYHNDMTKVVNENFRPAFSYARANADGLFRMSATPASVPAVTERGSSE